MLASINMETFESIKKDVTNALPHCAEKIAAQYAPFPPSTTHTVFIKIHKSSQIDQFWI